MSNRIEKAVANHKKGYNCSQAVVCAYSDLFGIDEQTAFKISEGFGGGMGGMRDGTCGAVSAMYMLAGMKGSAGSVESGLTKQQTYAQVRELADAFKKMNGSTVCRDLLGQGAEGVKRSCDGCIEDAARIIEQLLTSGSI